jgi:hypothetical protein
MKTVKFFAPVVTISAVTFLLILGVPMLGFTQQPHTCPNGHQGQSLGGRTSFTFTFAKNCSPYTSNTVEWKFVVYRYADNTPIPGCSWGPFTVGTTPRAHYCNGLPLGAYPRVKVIINYKTSPNGSWMTHTELYGN